jgi:hypothetical protein
VSGQTEIATVCTVPTLNPGIRWNATRRATYSATEQDRRLLQQLTSVLNLSGVRLNDF